MWIEACEPLLVRWPRGVIALDPGRPVEVADEVAQKLRQRAPGRVRSFRLLRPQDLVPGTRVWWYSPLLGWCTGEVIGAPEGGCFVVREHSVTKQLATVPAVQVWAMEPR